MIEEHKNTSNQAKPGMSLAIEAFQSSLTTRYVGCGFSAGKKEIIVDKSEIEEMKPGMTSEELDALTTDGEEALESDDGLAEEALKAAEEEKPAEETAETEEETTEEAEEEVSETDLQLRAKDSKIASQKHEVRDLELENAKLQGELEARRQLGKPDPLEKSPTELAMEAEGVDNPDDLEKPFAVFQAQLKWEEKQKAKEAENDQYKQRQTELDNAAKALQTGDLSATKAGDGLDFKTVIALGQGYLDEADLLKVKLVSDSKGVEAATRKAYDLCKDAILAADNDDSKLLKNALNAVKSQAKSKTKKTDIDALTTEDEETDEAENKDVNTRLYRFITN